MIRAVKKLIFTRRKFGGSNEDIEKALEKTKGAIFLKRIGNQPYDPREEGEKLFKVLSILFPKSTLDILAKRLCEQPQSSEEKSEAPPPKFGAILNI